MASSGSNEFAKVANLFSIDRLKLVTVWPPNCNKIWTAFVDWMLISLDRKARSRGDWMAKLFRPDASCKSWVLRLRLATALCRRQRSSVNSNGVNRHRHRSVNVQSTFSQTLNYNFEALSWIDRNSMTNFCPSPDFLYHQTLNHGSGSTEIEILDTSDCKVSEPRLRPKSDGFCFGASSFRLQKKSNSLTEQSEL